MPAVRTASAPEIVPNAVAMSSATGTVVHHGQPRLIVWMPLSPKIATM